MIERADGTRLWQLSRIGTGLVLCWRLQGDALLARLWGELDLATAPGLEHEIAGARAAGTASVRLDLAGLQFLAVAGVHAFRRIDEGCHQAGGRLVLVRPDTAAKRLLAISGAADLCDPGLRSPRG
jgi:anti-sigma B factor antagonist